MADDTSPTQEAPAPPPATPPETQAAAPPAAPLSAAEPAPAAPTANDPPVPVVAEYIAETPRTYGFPGAPQTAALGDVCQLPYLPADGCWKPSNKLITRLPDNHPDNQPGPPDLKLVATSYAEHVAILERLGLSTEGGAQ